MDIINTYSYLVVITFAYKAPSKSQYIPNTLGEIETFQTNIENNPCILPEWLAISRLLSDAVDTSSFCSFLRRKAQDENKDMNYYHVLNIQVIPQ